MVPAHCGSSPAGMLEFLQHFAELSRRLPGKRLQSWVAAGIEVAQRQAEAGQAYFALESAAAQDRLRTLQKLVTFADVVRVLQLYTEGLLGRRLELRTTTVLPARSTLRDGRCRRLTARLFLSPSRWMILPRRRRILPSIRWPFCIRQGFTNVAHLPLRWRSYSVGCRTSCPASPPWVGRGARLGDGLRGLFRRFCAP